MLYSLKEWTLLILLPSKLNTLNLCNNQSQLEELLELPESLLEQEEELEL